MLVQIPVGLSAGLSRNTMKIIGCELLENFIMYNIYKYFTLYKQSAAKLF